MIKIVLTTLLFLSVGPSAFAQTLSYPVSSPAPNDDISTFRQRAHDLFVGITGLSVGIDDARVVKMEALLKASDTAGAAAVATSDPSFFNIRVLNMAKAMSTRAETQQTTINDFASTMVGIARDGLDARTLLTGNFYYVDNNLIPKHTYGAGTAGTIHFQQFDALHYSPYATLQKFNGEIVNTGTLPDNAAAGVLTSQQFMSQHAVMGTNRRIIDYTFREFECVALADWEDATRPDDWVGRDVDRLAGGSNDHYQNTCRACHAQLDAFRGAFAYFDFSKSVLYSPGSVVTCNNGGSHCSTPEKYARNYTIYPAGHVTANDSFANYATGFLNADKFGWRSPATGNGPHEFGTLIANSQGFSRCMVRRFFTSICKRAPLTSEETLVRTLATQFESTYKITDLAAMVANHPSCLPAGGQ